MASCRRYFKLDRAKLDASRRTVPIAFSSEYPVLRYDEDSGDDYWEVLDHDPANIDLSRLRSGAPLLDLHDMRRHIGVVESPTIGSDRKGRAVVRFGRGALANEIFQDFKDGIRKHISVGYELTKVVGTEKAKDGRKLLRFAWAPYEISSVPVPADPQVGVGRSDPFDPSPVDSPPISKNMLRRNLLFDSNPQDGNGNPGQGQDPVEKERKRVRKINKEAQSSIRSFPQHADAIRELANKAVDGGTKPKAFREELGALTSRAATSAGGVHVMPNPQSGAQNPGSAYELRNSAREDERKRVRKITEAAEQLAKDFPEGAAKFRQMAAEAIKGDTKWRDFNSQLLTAIPGIRKVNPITPASLGMTQRDQEQYSILRAVRCVLENKGKLGGLEGEIHAEMLKRNIGVEPAGFWVPHDLMVPANIRSLRLNQQRDLNVATFGQGGAFVPTLIQTPIIELLRNRMVCNRLGVQPLSGLSGNVAIPRQTGAATAYALPESATLTKSNQAIDQILLTPHRVGAWNDYTKQLLLQSSVDVENFIRDDLMKVLAIKWDYLILQGAGANSEPTGIMNTAGIGSIKFGGAATWAQILSFETALALANADVGTMAYVTTPNVRGKYKNVPKVGTTFPVFIWETFDWGDGYNDGVVNGYRAAATNQILNDGVVFGHWSDAIGPAMWGGYDVVVNPYTRDTDGVVRITVNTFGDVAVRHAASFCWSADSGAQ